MRASMPVEAYNCEPDRGDGLANPFLKAGAAKDALTGQSRCLLMARRSYGASTNMAIDEALLRRAVEIGYPILRFYGWSQPAATFGYFQRIDEVAKMTRLRPLIRRPTGGGLTPHDRDWTYSLTVPPGFQWYGLRAPSSYHLIHSWIQAVFSRLGHGAELARRAALTIPGQCFAGAEKSDVLWHGRKIAGAAQRRNHHGLLIQGSVHCPFPSLQRGRWEEAFCDEAQRRWGVRWAKLDVEEVAELSHRLNLEKYSQSSYNRRR